MDPDACVARIVDALQARVQVDAAEAAGALGEWIDNGGFPPRLESIRWLREVVASTSSAPTALVELLEVTLGA